MPSTLSLTVSRPRQLPVLFPGSLEKGVGFSSVVFWDSIHFSRKRALHPKGAAVRGRQTWRAHCKSIKTQAISDSSQAHSHTLYSSEDVQPPLKQANVHDKQDVPKREVGVKDP